MTPNEKAKLSVTVYSSSEEAVMSKSQFWREKLFLPLLKLLKSCKVTPNLLTFISLLSGIGFCFTFGLALSLAKPLALSLLALHVLLDGLDGPLARHLKIASNRGSFTDSVSDQLIVALTTITMIHYGVIGIIPGTLYLFFYTAVVVFAMVRSSLAIPYSWLIRPRLIIYAWFLVELYLWPGSLNYILWFFIVVSGWKTLTGFYKIRKML